MWITLIGLVLGLVLSFGLTHFIAGLLYGVGPNDLMTVLGVVVLLGAISLLACYIPAHRAMHANPVTAIREL
jgi:ABC-type antimicrobial peptide transport system permease subunit